MRRAIVGLTACIAVFLAFIVFALSAAPTPPERATAQAARTEARAAAADRKRASMTPAERAAWALAAERARELERDRERARQEARAIEAAARARRAASAAQPECDISGEIPAAVRRAICGIATSAHGDPSGMRLTIMATRPVAAAIAVQGADTRNALATLANSWRVGIGRNLGYVEVFYGQAHLATVRAASNSPARVTFH